MDSSLIPVMSALGGVALAQGVAMLQSWIDRQNKREILLRTKYEELGEHFLASIALPAQLLKCATHEETIATTQQTDSNKAHLLALVYFPELRVATGQYIEAYSALCSTAIALYNPDDKRILGFQVPSKPEYVVARNAYLAARNRLQDEIEKHASAYAKS